MNFFYFDPPTPPYVGTLFCGGGVGWGGGVLQPLCVDLDPGSEEFFS